MNIRMAAERIAGRTTGRVTRAKVCSGDEPDMRAASSRPESIEVKAGAMIR